MAVDDVGDLKAAADAIRFSPGRRIRFCPMVYFSESPHLDAIRTCVEMGFDDVITLDCTVVVPGLVAAGDEVELLPALAPA